MPALPAIDPDDAGSFARGMSDNGRVVGWGHDFTAGFPPQCTRHPLYWENIEADAFDLGDFMPDGQEGNAARAEDVNNLESPAVVGWNDETETALLWEQEDENDWVVTDLNAFETHGSCRWTIEEAHAVNDSVWIAAIAVDKWFGGTHAILLVPDDPCLGDLTYNSVVDTDDLVMVINNWGTCSSYPTPCAGDGTCNGIVDVDDLLLVINNYGSCPLPDLQDQLVGGSSSGQGNNDADSLEEIVEVLQAFGVPSWIVEAIEQLIGQ